MLIDSVWAGATTVASPGLRLLLRYRAGRGKEIEARLPERRGIDPTERPDGELVWLHAASVGETVSILPVLTSIARQAPDVSVLLTTGTVTSAKLLAQRLRGMDSADRVIHRFVPLDVPAWVNRFLDHWRPDVAGFVESELWPNILAGCRARRIPTMLINARMSARSHTAWSRVPSLSRRVLGGFARIHARGEEDAARLRDLGAGHVEVSGDLKLAATALPADPALLTDMTERLAGRPVFLAASTHPGEEPLIADVHDLARASHPGLLTIVAPRHPERGPELAELLHAPRRGAGQPPPDGGLWVADTLGELGVWYRISHVAFVGRSLLPPGGGQNLLEPARLGRAIATGPHTANFTDHVALLRAAEALRVTEDVPALASFVRTMLTDDDARRRMEDRARMAVKIPENLVDDTARALLALMTGE